MIKKFDSNKARLRRHQRIRRHLEGTPARPRLNVFRSGHHIYAQVIDDSTGLTMVSASSLDESLHDFTVKLSTSTERKSQAAPVEVEQAAEVATEAPAAKGKGAKTEKAAGKAAPAKGNRPTQSKTVLPAAQKGSKKTPVEALAPIADNRKVALAREVGKLVARRAKEKGVTQVVFDRGGYAYHGRVAALAEGAREVGLNF
jgi:ribosomal protein L18